MAKTRVIRAEYFEDKIQKWVALYEGTNLETAKERAAVRVCGDPQKRIAEYDKIGVRKVRYSFVREITDAAVMDV